MAVTEVTSIEQFHEIINGDRPALIDFWATWCGPCKVIRPIFHKFAEQYPNVDFFSVDTEDQEAISEEVGIRVMPSFFAFKKGQKIGETTGALPAPLQALIEKLNNGL